MSKYCIYLENDEILRGDDYVDKPIILVAKKSDVVNMIKRHYKDTYIEKSIDINWERGEINFTLEDSDSGEMVYKEWSCVRCLTISDL